MFWRRTRYLRLTKLGRVDFSEIEKLLNTLINTDEDYCDDPEDIDGGRIANKMADSFELDDLEAKGFLEGDTDGQRTMVETVVPPINTSRSKIYDSLVDINIDWNNFQELKLILYSIDFCGYEKLPFDQLEKRMDRF